jgi:hypothetical protein
MAIVSVPKNVWTTIVTASTDTIIENMGHSEVFITTETPSLTGFKSEKLTITTLQSGETAKVYSVNKDTEVNHFAVGAGGATNLTYTAATRLLESSTGTDVTLPLVGADAGLMTAADKTKLDGIASGAQVNVATDLAYTDATRVLTSSTGTDVTLPLVGANPGLMTAADKTKLDGIESGAQVNVATDLAYTAATRSLTSSTGTDVTLPLVTSTDPGLAPLSGGGTTNFLRADGTWAAPPAGGSVALTDLTDVTVAAAAQGQVLVRGASEFQNLTAMTFALGPFFVNDVPGTATTQATIGYFNTATALSRNGNDIKMTRAGRVVGLIITSDAARTAGTATARVRIAGAGTAFDGGSVVLDATNTTSDSSFVAYGSGVAFTAGQTVGADVVTSGWTPITANVCLHVVVMLEPF